MYKKYYNINEAAKYLTNRSGEEINESDVFYHAAQGSFRLCIWLERNVAIFGYQSNGYPESAPFVINKKFRGYVQIPKDTIAPNHEDYNILFAEPLEPFKEPGNAQILSESTAELKKIVRPIKNPGKYNNRFICSSNNEIVDNIDYDSIVIKTKEIQIPKQDLLDFVSKTKSQLTETTQKNIPELGTEAIPESGGIGYVIYEKLRTYCMQDLGQYINGAEYDTMRRDLSKSFKGQPLGRMEHERQRAHELFQCHDLTPREKSAAYLLGIISQYRIITWHGEPVPPHGHEQLPPLEKTKDDALMHQTNQAISEYVCHLPEREAAALLGAWEASLVTNSTPDTVNMKATPATNTTLNAESFSPTCGDFRKMDNLNANELAIEFVAGENGGIVLSITARRVKKRVTLDELDLFDRRKGELNLQGILLLGMASNQTVKNTDTKTSKRISRLRKTLKLNLGITGASIQHNENIGYKALFNISDKRSEADKRAKREGKHRTGSLDTMQENGYQFHAKEDYEEENDEADEFLKKSDSQ